MRRLKGAAAVFMALLLILCAACSEKPVFEYDGAGEYVTVSVIDHLGEYRLEPVKIGIREGATVYDCTVFALQNEKMHFDFAGAGAAVYFKAIDQLYERDEGPLSGWLYKVGGSFENAGKSCGAYIVKDGDVVEWVYTTDLGKDAGITEIS